MPPFCVRRTAIVVVELEYNSNSFLSVVYSIRRAPTVLCHLELQGIFSVLSSPSWSLACFALRPPILRRVLLL